MKVSIVEPLSGEKIERAEWSDGALTMFFSGGWTIKVNNRILGGMDKVVAEKLVGRSVSFLDDKEEQAVIAFTDGSSITIGLKDRDYTGPEAMEIYGPNDLMMIWN